MNARIRSLKMWFLETIELHTFHFADILYPLAGECHASGPPIWIKYRELFLVLTQFKQVIIFQLWTIEDVYKKNHSQHMDFNVLLINVITFTYTNIISIRLQRGGDDAVAAFKSNVRRLKNSVSKNCSFRFIQTRDQRNVTPPVGYHHL